MRTNGNHPDDDYGAVIDQHVAGLREAAEAAQRLAAIKRNEYDAALDQAKRLQKALDALVPPDRAAKAKGANWQISDDKIADVLALIKRIDVDEFTAADLCRLADKGQLSSGTAVKALDVLRQREVVRFVRTAKGGGKVMTLMPDA